MVSILRFQKGIRMGMKGGLSNFELDMTVGEWSNKLVGKKKKNLKI